MSGINKALPPAGSPIPASPPDPVEAPRAAPFAEDARVAAADLPKEDLPPPPAFSPDPVLVGIYRRNERLRRVLHLFPEKMARKIYQWGTHPHTIRGRLEGPGYNIVLLQKLASDMLFRLPAWNKFTETTVRVYGRASFQTTRSAARTPFARL